MDIKALSIEIKTAKPFKEWSDGQKSEHIQALSKQLVSEFQNVSIFSTFVPTIPDYFGAFYYVLGSKHWAKILERELNNAAKRPGWDINYLWQEADYKLRRGADPRSIAKWFMYLGTGMDKYEYEDHWRHEYTRQIELREIEDENQMWTFFEVFNQ